MLTPEKRPTVADMTALQEHLRPYMNWVLNHSGGEMLQLYRALQMIDNGCWEVTRKILDSGWKDTGEKGFVERCLGSRATSGCGS